MKRFALIIVFISSFTGLRAQVEWESQLWTSAEVEYNFKGPWSLSFAPEFRYRLQPFMLRTIFPDISATYKFNKQFSVAVHYRYKYTNEGMGNHFFTKNYLVDVLYKRKVNNWQFGLRLRGGTVEDGDPGPDLFAWQSWETREKFSAAYKLSKQYELFSAVEYFQLPVEDPLLLQQTRFSVGMEYSINKSQKLQIGLLFQNQPDIKRLNPAVSYSLAIDELIKKKKR